MLVERLPRQVRGTAVPFFLAKMGGAPQSTIATKEPPNHCMVGIQQQPLCFFLYFSINTLRHGVVHPVLHFRFSRGQVLGRGIYMQRSSEERHKIVAAPLSASVSGSGCACVAAGGCCQTCVTCQVASCCCCGYLLSVCVGVGFVLCSLLLLLLSSCLLAEMLFFSFFFLSGFCHVVFNCGRRTRRSLRSPNRSGSGSARGKTRSGSSFLFAFQPAVFRQCDFVSFLGGGRGLGRTNACILYVHC